MPQPDKYAPGEALIDTLSKMSRQIVNSFARGEVKGERQHDLAQYLIKSFDSLVLTAPSITIAEAVETLTREWENLLAIVGGVDQELNVESKKLLIANLCSALTATKDKFDPADLEQILALLSVKEVLFSPVKLQAGGLAELYQTTIGSLEQEISIQSFGF